MISGLRPTTKRFSIFDTTSILQLALERTSRTFADQGYRWWLIKNVPESESSPLLWDNQFKQVLSPSLGMSDFSFSK